MKSFCHMDSSPPRLTCGQTIKNSNCEFHAARTGNLYPLHVMDCICKENNVQQCLWNARLPRDSDSVARLGNNQPGESVQTCLLIITLVFLF